MKDGIKYFTLHTLSFKSEATLNYNMAEKVVFALVLNVTAKLLCGLFDLTYYDASHEGRSLVC